MFKTFSEIYAAAEIFVRLKKSLPLSDSLRALPHE